MKNILKKAAALLLFIAMMIGLVQGSRFVLLDDYRLGTRLTIHEMYDRKTDFEILLVGSSHVYRGIDPHIAGDIFQAETLNLSTGNQFMDGSRILVEEAVKHNPVKRVYLDLYYLMEQQTDYGERDVSATYIISDYLRPSVRKYLYIMRATDQSMWTNGFIPARRNWANLFTPYNLYSTVMHKLSSSYRNYEWPAEEGEKSTYLGKGYYPIPGSTVGDHPTISQKSYGPIDPIDYEYQSDWYHDLEAIIHFCAKKNIELTLFMTPMPEWTLAGKGNYQAYHDFLQKIADEQGVSFYDFNFMKESYFDNNNQTMFQDFDHLNKAGAESFTPVFARFFAGEITEEELFYSSLQEKMSAEEAKVYGIAGPHPDEENGLKHCYAVANRDNLLYRITLLEEDGTEMILQDFCEETQFAIPEDFSGTIRLEWKTSQDGEIHVLEAEV